jgi:hypothetical protein
MEDVYAVPGAEVIIGFHQKCSDYQNLYDMGRLLGTKTKITNVIADISSPNKREIWCTVTADCGRRWWPAYDMILASDIDLLTPEQKDRVK